MEKQSNTFIIGLGIKEHEYKIGNVTYIVGSRFQRPFESEQITLSDRMKSYLGGDFADLTEDIEKDRIDSEYVCSAAGEEELCSRNNQN